jgi:hypothetical protein
MEKNNIGTRDYGLIEGLDEVKFEDPDISKNFQDFSNS